MTEMGTDWGMKPAYLWRGKGLYEKEFANAKPVMLWFGSGYA